ncbi:MAG: EAL domain-containing protein [Actinobacteria bacterium]|nr:EAL domain-containing protein [Actinomycetota bacterium]
MGILTFVSLTYLTDVFPFTFIFLAAIVITLRLRQMGAVASSATLCSVSIWALLDNVGNPAGLVSTHAVISLQVATATVAVTGLLMSSILSERDNERTFLGVVLENLDAGVVACDAKGTLTLFNRATRELHNLPAERIDPDKWAEHYDLYRADGVTPLPMEEIPLFRALGGEQVQNAEMVIAPKSGEPRALVVNGHSLDDGNGRLMGAVVAMHDVTGRRKAEAALVRQALHDPLTDLPNRLLLRDRLEHALVSRDRNPASLALLVLNLDGFKIVNDSLGHEAGDEVLVSVADRLRSSLRSGDTIARLGGDEFAVLLENSTRDHAVGIAKQILALVRTPVPARDQSITVDTSIGIVVSEPDTSAEEMLRNADLAMYAAKSHGKGNMQVFDPSMHEAVIEQLSLETELRQAITGHQLILHYQPLISLVTGHLLGFEALVRWNHAQRGLVSPASFIPIAEATGLIVPLGEWVLHTACLQARRWQDDHSEARDLEMNVNVSVRQLQSDGIVDVIRTALRDSGLRAEQLVLEITESVVMHRAEALAVLNRLHDIGIRFAIDDFGTGYSSLSRLHSLPIDKVKIDKSFVDATANGEPAPMVATIAMAHSLGLQTVAEGVESTDQLPFLHLNGCDEVQGYLFGRPAEAAAMTELLRDRGAGSLWTELKTTSA